MKTIILTLVLTGGCLALFMSGQPPFLYASFILGWMLLCFSLKKPKKVTPPLLRFGKLQWNAFNLGHILVLGQTRRGKTLSALTNILTQLTKNCDKWGGLVLGVKGTEHNFLDAHFKLNGRDNDIKVLQVRPEGAASWSPPFRINITGDKRLPWSAYASMIVDTGKALAGEKGDSFWTDTAEQSITHAFVLIDGLGMPPTIPNIYNLLMSDPTRLNQKIDDLADKEELTSQELQAMEYLKTVFVKTQAKEQLEGTRGTLKRFLGFFLNDDLSEVFCSENPNVQISDVDKGHVIATSIPQRYVKERKYIHTLLKSLGYYHGMLRFDEEARDPEYIGKCNRLVYVFDEAQEVVTASETGMGDHTIADRIGGAKVTLVFCMQSSRSPEPKIGREKKENLINHFSTRFIFQLGEQSEAKEMSDYLGDAKQRKVSKSMGRSGHGRNISMDYQPRVKPVALLSLDNHQCLITHPNKDFILVDLPPLSPDGTVPRWYIEGRKNRKSLAKLRKHIFYGR